MIKLLEGVPNFGPGMSRENEVRAKINEIITVVNELHREIDLIGHLAAIRPSSFEADGHPSGL